MENSNEFGSSEHASIANAPDMSKISVPISVFTNGASCLESISKYLKESVGMKYCAIADIMNRNDRTIWSAHHDATKKSADFSVEESSVKIPISIFQDRSLSVLEAIAEYSKDTMGMRYCNIALLLGKDQRTVWTVYSRAKKERRAYAN